MLMKSQKISTRVASYSRTLESKKPNNRILLSRSSYCFSKTEAQAPRFKKVIVNILTCAFLITTNIAQASADNPSTIENSVIKIYTTQAAPDYFTPWRLLSPRQSSGSGSVIQGNKILTNAHVVANASYVQAQKHNDPRRYLAQVTFISHEADLALLTVEEPGFFDNLTPLAFGTLPAALQEVSVYGYPIGGKSLSISQGIL